MNRFFKFSQLTLLAAALVATPLFTACSSDDDPKPAPIPAAENDFHIAYANGTGNPSGTLVQGLSSLAEGTITPIGHQMESSRTARIFASQDGTTIWSLNYTVGSIEKLTYVSGDKYTRVARFDASVPLGSTTVRFTKLNEEVASVHVSKAVAQYEDEKDPSTYKGHRMSLSIGMLDLAKMELREGYNPDLELPVSGKLAELAKQGYYISRVDAPVLSGGKLYYGAVFNKFNPLDTKNPEESALTSTIVLDYPSLANPQVVFADKELGSTNGYRTPTQHINEAGEILQLTSGNEEVHILKLVNGKYTSFDFNLSKVLGKEMTSNGYFYAGNGIAYVPYQDLTGETWEVGVNPNGRVTRSASWKVARVDLNKGTAVDLNVPDKLWLTQYQSSVVRDGVFYIALAPVGTEGNIYMFDVKSESPEGRKGATLKGTGAEQYFIGIY